MAFIIFLFIEKESEEMLMAFIIFLFIEKESQEMVRKLVNECKS